MPILVSYQWKSWNGRLKHGAWVLLYINGELRNKGLIKSSGDARYFYVEVTWSELYFNGWEKRGGLEKGVSLFW